jgi:predicted component of type VI protein secretion system
MTAGKQQGQVLEVKLSQFVVGRDPQCHLRPASALISKRHCAILQREGKAFVRDFDSTNGTFVNNEPVKGEIELHHDDQLKIGPLQFTVRLEATPAVNRPTPAPPTKAAATTKVAPAIAKAPSAGATAGASKPASAEQAPAEETKEVAHADDDIAAMLLSLHDDTDSSSSSGGDKVPDGSTVMELQVPPDMMDTAPNKPADKDKGKPVIGNTSTAAKSILEKYMRRPRG